MLNINEIVGQYDIVFLTLDTLRYDVASQELEAGRLPVLGQYISQWERRHTPGSFTYAAHHAFFSGFFPTPEDNPMAPRPMAVSFAGSRSISPNTRCFQAATIVEGLADEGYHTLCIGGVGFFNKQNPLSCVLPKLFIESHWSKNMGVTCAASTQYQVEQALLSLDKIKSDQRVFLFMNISAIHQPNYYYLEAAKASGRDDINTHAAALRYVDSQLTPLFSRFKTRCNTLFFVCSDHGTTYGEQGYVGHRLAHDVVWTVPYAEFVQEAMVNG